jgi:hypothetical protein
MANDEDNVIHLIFENFEVDEPMCCPECGSLTFNLWASGEIWCAICSTLLEPTIDFGEQQDDGPEDGHEV